MSAQSVAVFQSKGGCNGEEANFPLMGDDTQLWVIISDLQGHDGSAGGSSMVVLLQLGC